MPNPYQIVPSLLSADFGALTAAAQAAEAAGAPAVQIDVMDGQFVPPITFGAGLVAALRPQVKLVLDVHLMIVQPEQQIAEFIKAGANRIFVHVESTVHIHRALMMVHESGVEAGVTLNPGTPLSAIEAVLPMADIVQVMTVNPGYGGQAYIPEMNLKIAQLRALLNSQNRSQIPIAVDGGIGVATIGGAARAGARVFIAGSSVYNAQPIGENIAALLKAAQDG